jgi:predicted NAD-dependent protein-ADP-ribosyltransferase YbiA (DUF1768 family)
MKKGLIYKFSQNPELLKALIDTGDCCLVEASDKDPYWGGLLPDSKNRLGALLVELRENYKNNSKIFIEGSGLEPITPNF